MEWDIDRHLSELTVLLDQGKTQELLDAINKTLETKSWKEDALSPDYAELLALRGMAYYRRKEFDLAKASFEQALACAYGYQNERAIYGMTYLAAYVDKDPDKVREWMEKFPEGAARDNAHMIIMRSPEYIETNGLEQTHLEVMRLLDKYLMSNPVDSLNVANLMHNAGRFFLVKAADQEQCGYARSKRTCASAVAALTLALSLYGTGNMNLHHRAAANYWMSMAMEKVFGPAAALSAVEQSLELWDRQLALDPENPHYQKGRQGAADRLRDLKDAVSAL